MVFLGVVVDAHSDTRAKNNVALLKRLSKEAGSAYVHEDVNRKKFIDEELAKKFLFLIF
jgi:hypothetical protein